MAQRCKAVEPAGAKRVNILGVAVSASTIEGTLLTFERWVETGSRNYVCVVDVHSVMQGQWDPAFRKVLNRAGLATSDGMPLVWLCRLAHGPGVSRVYGPDLLLAACKAGLAAGRRHYFLGGGPGVAETLAGALTQKFPGLVVAGAYAPPFKPMSPEEEAAMVDAVNAARPDYIWVGLGAPKQEYWMSAFRERLHAPVMVGVGAAFDFISGAKPQAPALLRATGMEWLFRLLSEPTRLWPRYRRVIPGFLYRLALQKLKLVDYAIDVD